MSDRQIILFMLAASSFGVLAIILYLAADRVARSEIQTASVGELLTPSLDRAAVGIVSGARRWLISISLFLLLVARRLITVAKSYLHQVEKKFSVLIEAVRGRGHRDVNNDRRGAVSFFLEQIKLDQVETGRRRNHR